MSFFRKSSPSTNSKERPERRDSSSNSPGKKSRSLREWGSSWFGSGKSSPPSKTRSRPTSGPTSGQRSPSLSFSSSYATSPRGAALSELLMNPKQPSSVNAETLTEQERLNRLLYKPDDVKAISSRDPWFESFVILGLDRRSLAEQTSAAAAAQGDGATGDSRSAAIDPCDLQLEPRVLFSYPTRAVPDGLIDFCFPSPFRLSVRQKYPMQTLEQLQRRLKEERMSSLDSGYLFFVTNELAQTQYGVVLKRWEIVRSVSPTQYLVADRCFCLLSRVPFFLTHFAILSAIADVDDVELIRAQGKLNRAATQPNLHKKLSFRDSKKKEAADGDETRGKASKANEENEKDGKEDRTEKAKGEENDDDEEEEEEEAIDDDDDDDDDEDDERAATSRLVVAEALNSISAAQAGDKEARELAANQLSDLKKQTTAPSSDTMQRLCDAAAAGSYFDIQALLMEGADPNHRDANGNTPLHWAALGTSEATPLLLSASGNPNAKNVNGETPLHWAAKNGNLAVAQCLLAAGASKDERDALGRRPGDVAAPSLRVLLIGGSQIVTGKAQRGAAVGGGAGNNGGAGAEHHRHRHPESPLSASLADEIAETTAALAKTSASAAKSSTLGSAMARPGLSRSSVSSITMSNGGAESAMDPSGIVSSQAHPHAHQQQQQQHHHHHSHHHEHHLHLHQSHHHQAPPHGSHDGDRSVASWGLTVREREKEARENVRKILATFRRQKIPARGHSIQFDVGWPPREIHFRRPHFDDQAESLVEWGLTLVVHTLKRPKLMLQLIMCVLLEKKVAIKCKHAHIVTAIVTTLLALVRPFSLRCVVIPLLPEKMYSVIEAPTPFLVGLTKPVYHVPSDLFLLDLDKPRRTDDDIPFDAPPGESVEPLPNFAQINRQLAPFFKKILKITALAEAGAIAASSGGSTIGGAVGGGASDLLHSDSSASSSSSRSSLPSSSVASSLMGHFKSAPSPSLLALSEGLCLTLQQYFVSWFKGFRRHCMRDVSDPNNPITVFMNESYLATSPPAWAGFMTGFLETQTFRLYCDQRVRKRDELEDTRPKTARGGASNQSSAGISSSADGGVNNESELLADDESNVADGGLGSTAPAASSKSPRTLLYSEPALISAKRGPSEEMLSIKEENEELAEEEDQAPDGDNFGVSTDNDGRINDARSNDE